MVKELSEKETFKFKDKRDDKKVSFTDPKGHKIDIEASGLYSSVIVYCDKCYKGYQLTKEEVDQL